MIDRLCVSWSVRRKLYSGTNKAFHRHLKTVQSQHTMIFRLVVGDNQFKFILETNLLSTVQGFGEMGQGDLLLFQPVHRLPPSHHGYCGTSNRGKNL